MYDKLLSILSEIKVGGSIMGNNKNLTAGTKYYVVQVEEGYGLSIFLPDEHACEGYTSFINPGDLVNGLAEVYVNIGHWADWDGLAKRLEKEKLTVMWRHLMGEHVNVIDVIIWDKE